MENGIIDHVSDIEKYIEEHGDNRQSWSSLRIVLCYKKQPSRLRSAYLNAKKIIWQRERIEKAIKLSKVLNENDLAKELGITKQNLRNYAARHGIEVKKPDYDDDDELYSTRSESYGCQSLVFLAGIEAREIISSKWVGI